MVEIQNNLYIFVKIYTIINKFKLKFIYYINMASEECRELKNLKYKTMLLNGNNKKTLSSVIKDVENLDLLLDEETQQNKKETWNKLDKSIKMNKINEYIKKFNRKTHFN